MKRFLLPLLLILGLGGLAFGQNITQGLQGAQDGRFIGMDAAKNVYWPGHYLLNTTTNPAPVLSNCGTSPTYVGTDNAGKLTTGSAATTCTITFGTAYVTAPACIVQENGGVTNPTFTTSTTALTITVDVASTVYSVWCTSIS
jgi:hypothetical protein